MPHSRDEFMSIGSVDTFSILPTRIRLIGAGRIDRFTTHRFALEQAIDALETSAHAGGAGALKVLRQRPA